MSGQDRNEKDERNDEKFFVVDVETWRRVQRQGWRREEGLERELGTWVW